jgi:hypothetical protein
MINMASQHIGLLHQPRLSRVIYIRQGGSKCEIEPTLREHIVKFGAVSFAEVKRYLGKMQPRRL